jgi:hypothetical protein
MGGENHEVCAKPLPKNRYVPQKMLPNFKKGTNIIF